MRTSKNREACCAWFIVGIVAFVAVILASLNDMKWWFGGQFGDSWPAILAAVVLLALMYFIIWGGEKKGGSKDDKD